jgi:pRiA4b ORF-3-like protein
VFGEALNYRAMSYVDRIARLRIVLDDTEPVVWRTVEVPLTMSVRGLHKTIRGCTEA